MLPHDHFSPGGSSGGGMQVYCKKHMAERQCRHFNENPGLSQLRDAATRAAEKGLEFTITYEDVLAKDVDICPYMGIPIRWTHIESGKHGRKGRQGAPDAKSLDRIDSSKGYTLDNLLVCSWKANNIKGSATWEELLQISNALKAIMTKNETTN